VKTIQSEERAFVRDMERRYVNSVSVMKDTLGQPVVVKGMAPQWRNLCVRWERMDYCVLDMELVIVEYVFAMLKQAVSTTMGKCASVTTSTVQWTLLTGCAVDMAAVTVDNVYVPILLCLEKCTLERYVTALQTSLVVLIPEIHSAEYVVALVSVCASRVSVRRTTLGNTANQDMIKR
jgi:hypothetical protein